MKDNNNLLDYNQWSGTEYNKNTLGFTVNGNDYVLRINNNEWSEIGEDSLKCINLQNSQNWIRIYYSTNVPSKTVNLTLTVNSKTTTKVYLIERKGTEQLKTIFTSISEGDVTNVNLSFHTTLENTGVLIHIVSTGDINEYYYLDKISLTTS